MTEQPTPELSANENETNTETSEQSEYFEVPVPKLETEQRKSLHDLIVDVRRDLDRLTPFAIEVLNPFSSIEELKKFSKEHGQGDNRVVCFMEVGEGEDVQGDYIQSFIKRFFPRIEVATLNYLAVKVKRKVIKTQMMDFFEIFKLKDPKYTGFERPKKKDIVFSMTPTKILHSNTPNPEIVAQLKASLFQELERVCQDTGVIMQSLNVPLLVGDMAVFRPAKEGKQFPLVANIDISVLSKIGTSFRIISPIEGEILCGFYDAQTDRYTEEARIPINQEKILRALYTIGDFSVIRQNKNKMEGVIAGTKVITTGGYSDITKNPNVVLDSLLRSRGHLVTIDEVAKIGLSQLGKVPQLTEQEVRDLYADYMKSQDRVGFEPSLKESMQRLIDRIVAPPENLMTFIRNLFN